MTTRRPKFPPVPARDDYAAGPDDPPRVWIAMATLERDDTYPSSTGGYRHLRLHFATMPRGATNWDTRRLDCDSPFYHLEFTSQGDQFRPDHLYAYGVEYRQIFSVDAAKAREMARTLDMIERRLHRLAEQYGHPSDATEYLLRLLRVLGIDTLVAETDASTFAVTGERYRSAPLAGNGSGVQAMLRLLIHQLWTAGDRARAADRAAAAASA